MQIRYAAEVNERPEQHSLTVSDAGETETRVYTVRFAHTEARPVKAGVETGAKTTE